MRIGRDWRRAVPLLLAAAMSIGTALADATIRVAQKGRQFRPTEIAIARGAVIAFSNEDEYLHQIYVDSPELKFDSDEQPPGKVIELAFPARGSFEVRCHIHPKMLLKVTVN